MPGMCKSCPRNSHQANADTPAPRPSASAVAEPKSSGTHILVRTTSHADCEWPYVAHGLRVAIYVAHGLAAGDARVTNVTF